MLPGPHLVTHKGAQGKCKGRQGMLASPHPSVGFGLRGRLRVWPERAPWPRKGTGPARGLLSGRVAMSSHLPGLQLWEGLGGRSRSELEAEGAVRTLGPGFSEPPPWAWAISVLNVHPGSLAHQIQPLGPPPAGTRFSPPRWPGYGPHRCSPGLAPAGCTWEQGKVGWTWRLEAAGNRAMSLDLTGRPPPGAVPTAQGPRFLPPTCVHGGSASPPGRARAHM